jgi:hypothetical protein
MINFDKMLTMFEPQAVINSLFEGWQPGQNVACSFADTRHEKGKDSSKSMSISLDGKVFCHACGYKATTLVNLYNDIFGYEFQEGCKAFYAEFIEPLVPDEYIDSAHTALINNSFIMASLAERRGLTLATAKQYQLGWKMGRLIIPVLNDINLCVNARRYDLLKKTTIKMLSYDKGFGKARLFPLMALAKQKVYIFEGELDTILARQHGINGITATTGALTWTEDMAKQFLDKTVIVVPDMDKAGLDGLTKRATLLLPYAQSVSFVKFPAMPEGGKDFTDFFMGVGKKDISSFLNLKVEPFVVTGQAPVKHKNKTIVEDEEVLTFTPTASEEVNLSRASMLFDYMKGSGAFFKNALGVLFFAKKGGDIFRVATNDQQFLGFLSSLSPLLNTATSSGKFILQHLMNRAQTLCTFSKSAFWSLLNGHDLFVYGTNGNLIHFKDGKYDKIPNAVNPHNVLLELPMRALPIQETHNNPGKGVQMLWDKVFSNIAISDEDRYFLMCWVLGIIFRVEVRNKPLMRLSASTAYGKSTASKLLSILLYGEEMLHHSASTIASMYSLAAEAPLLIFDNLETRNMVQVLEDFLIVAATGGMKSKRVADTTSSVAFERVDSLVLTNGIEPFSKHEILNRTIELPLNIDRFGKAHFHELKVIEDLKEHRDEILFSLFGLMSKRVIPRFMNNEVQRIAKHFGPHSKERFNEYFGVMAIILDAIWPYIPLKGYALPHDLVNHWISSQNISAKVSDESTNDVLHFLETFAKRRNNLMDAIVNVEHKDGMVRIKCTTRDLLSDFRLLAKHLSIRCPWQNERQLGTRLADASEILYKAGWDRRQKILSGRRVYEFIKKAEQAH